MGDNYVVVVFIHNTVSECHRVPYESACELFVNLAFNRISFRADLDCRRDFITYSDDVIMVQLIGYIDGKLQKDITTLIDHLKSQKDDNIDL
jgi:hypothetical protein